MYFKRKTTVILFLFAVYCLLFNSYSYSFSNPEVEVVNQIVAVINNQIITLTDLQIAHSLSLFEHEIEGKVESPLLFVLQRMVDQKVVIDAQKERIPIEESELDEALMNVVKRIGRDELQKRLGEFDLVMEDLSVFIVEDILYHKIISRRFENGVGCTLGEIEEYYNKTYCPAQEAEGLEPKPMMELLDEIELAVKKRKTDQQIVEWINNLKEQAEIEIKFKTVMEIR